MSIETTESAERPAWRVHAVLYVALLAIIAFLALRPGVGAAASDDESSVAPAARLDGTDIGHEEVLTRAAAQLEQLELQQLQCNLQVASERHGLMERTVEGIVRDRLIAAEAEAAGVAPGDWQAAEISRLEGELTDEDVDAFFVENEGRIRGEREQVEPQVRTFIARQRFVEELETGHEIEYLAEPYRLDVDPADGPAKGGVEATVTIVEWSDFECPYCKRVVPTLERLLDAYPEQVRLVFRHFPLVRSHPNAQAAAEAGVCAQEQGAFWELHDLMFEEQDALSAEDLAAKAERAGMDAEAFASCVERPEVAQRVHADRRAGARLGVDGTPALFINGRPLTGAVGYEAIAEIVDDEIERAGDAESGAGS